ncbi:unnamed protein product [Leptidea sinapis]|uniref:Uncharacterized protein n=1 Tax=Leptidea sinapis TaxID=189913 RepID=A0A5E4Q9J1_9NEOP|nr:unnamed protein product [Leptidea sinapis]
MECLQLRSPPGQFNYLISEQAKSLVALQELQNEVGALLEFRDLVIETFPNLRSKMAPSTPASGARRDWEPGVRVRRKLAGGGGDSSRTKPQPSVQDSGFSTETSCGKDAHSSASASTSASRSRPIEDDLWALLDVIQRKGIRLREEAESLRGELDERHSKTAEESFARVLSSGCGDCTDVALLRCERDALLAHTAHLEALAAARQSSPAQSPLGRLDSILQTPQRPPPLSSTDSKKFAAILQESNPVELQRQLLVLTVQNRVLSEKLKRETEQCSSLIDELERSRKENEDLEFRLAEKSVDLESAKSRLKQLEGKCGSNESLDRRDHLSMRDMEPLQMPDEPRIAETPRKKPSRIPLHTSHKGAAPRPPPGAAPRPPPGAGPRPQSAHSARSLRSSASGRSRSSRDQLDSSHSSKDKAPVPRQPTDSKCPSSNIGARTGLEDSLNMDQKKLETGARLVVEYLTRTDRLAPLFPRLHTVRSRPLPDDLLQDCRLAYENPQNLALELSKSILYEDADSIDLNTLRSSSGDSLWHGRPQQYFESMKYAASDTHAGGGDENQFEDD